MQIFLLISLCCLFACSASAQQVKVPLDTLTALDGFNAHFRVFTAKPEGTLVIPKVDTTNAKFMRLFYSWSVTSDPGIMILVLPQDTGERLYIDKNYDRDLTNDGPYIFFASSENECIFEISKRDDSEQKTRLMLSRRPSSRDVPDSIMTKYVDKKGNMDLKFVESWAKMSGDSVFRGEAGTYYWDNRICLRRGHFRLNDRSIPIGVWDWDNNGLFNDSNDVVLFSPDGSEMLSDQYPTATASRSDAVVVDGRQFSVKDVDRYGKYLVLETVDASNLVSDENRLARKKTFASRIKSDTIAVNSAIWDLKLESLSRDTISLRDYRGMFILLNFWGDWCKPCLVEIPALVAASELSKETNEVQFISFLQLANYENARKIISTHNLWWPQIVLDPVSERLFKINSFPTNVLILPDGARAVRLNNIEKAELAKHLK